MSLYWINSYVALIKSKWFWILMIAAVILSNLYRYFYA